MTDSDKKAFLWLGAILVAFAVVLARLVTGTWYGIFLAVGYALMWLWPLGAAGLSDASASSREERLREQNAEHTKEIARLRQLLAEPGDEGRRPSGPA